MQHWTSHFVINVRRQHQFPGGTQHIRGGKSDIFWVRILPKVISLGLNKTETMFMIVFDSKHDISGLAGGNPDSCLHCFGIFYVHVQVSKYKMS